MALTTYADIVEHLMDFIGSDADTQDMNFARRSVVAALREVALVKDWTIYKGTGRIVTNAAYKTGTFTYLQSSGAYPRQVTLTGGTWPSWAAQGVLLVGNVPYRVDYRASDTVISLDSTQNPGADNATATAFTLYRNTYPLPTNFRCLIGDMIEVGTKIVLSPTTYDRTFFDSHWRVSPSQPWMYAFIGDPSYQDQIAIAFSAPPDISRTYDFPYQRSPRRLLTSNYSTGTISSSGTTVTGSSDVNFTTNHVGCVLRVSASKTAPTGIYGSNPFAEERIVTGYTNSTTLTIDQAFTGSYSSKPYILSDPIDIDSSVMANFFLRTAELQIATIRRPADRGAIFAAWQKDLEEAMSADQKYRGQRGVGRELAMDFPFRQMMFGQLGADIANNG